MTDTIVHRPVTPEYERGHAETFGERPNRFCEGCGRLPAFCECGEHRQRLGKWWLSGRCSACGHDHAGKCLEAVGIGVDDDDRPIWRRCGCEAKP